MTWFPVSGLPLAFSELKLQTIFDWLQREHIHITIHAIQNDNIVHILRRWNNFHMNRIVIAIVYETGNKRWQIILKRIIKHLLRIEDKQNIQTAILIHLHFCFFFIIILVFNKSGFCQLYKEYLLGKHLLLLNVMGYLNPKSTRSTKNSATSIADNNLTIWEI